MKENNFRWNGNFAYGIGLFTADGCLLSDKRHLNFTSKDRALVKTFAKCWNLKNSIGTKNSGSNSEKIYYQIQFGNIKLYSFLESIGLHNKKSLTIKKLEIPEKFFPDFLRGLLDGDGSIGAYLHPDSQLPQMKIRFNSGSKEFLNWLGTRLSLLVDGGSLSKTTRAWSLAYGKRDSLKLINYMYYTKDIPQLNRKSKKALHLREIFNDFNPNRWQNRFTIKIFNCARVEER